MKKLIRVLSGVLVAASIGFAGHVSAQQQVEFNQEINPYVCVYTSVQSGGEAATTDTTCAEQPVSTVEEVLGDIRFPRIIGFFNTAETKIMRVEVNSRAFTSGIDDALDITSTVNQWELDLSQMSTPLNSGSYVVSVEVETYDGLLLRNQNAFTFYVPFSLTPPSSDSILPRVGRVPNMNNMILISPISPVTPSENPKSEVIKPDASPPVKPLDETKTDTDQQGWQTAAFVITAAAALAVAGIGINRVFKKFR